MDNNCAELGSSTGSAHQCAVQPRARAALAWPRCSQARAGSSGLLTVLARLAVQKPPWSCRAAVLLMLLRHSYGAKSTEHAV